MTDDMTAKHHIIEAKISQYVHHTIRSTTTAVLWQPLLQAGNGAQLRGGGGIHGSQALLEQR